MREESIEEDFNQNEKWAVFLMFTFNFEMFLQSFKSLVANGFSERIIVLDNSPNCSAANDYFVINHSYKIVPTPTRTRFAQVSPLLVVTNDMKVLQQQMMNIMPMIAMAEGYDFYFWTHADVVHHSWSEASPLFALFAIRVVREISKS